MNLAEAFLVNSLHDVMVNKMEVTSYDGNNNPTEVVYSRIDDAGEEAIVFTVTLTYNGTLLETVTKVAG